MNLRELLLQFAGRNEKTLNAEDVIEENIPYLHFMTETNESVTFIVTDDSIEMKDMLEEIDSILNFAGFEDYYIKPVIEENKREIILEF